MARRPLPYTLDQWQWTAHEEIAADTLLKATLGGGTRNRGAWSTRQNYYTMLQPAENPRARLQMHKSRDPDTMDVDAMRTSQLSKEEREALRKEKKCFHCKKKGHFARDCRSKAKEKGKQRDKGKAPSSCIRQAKVEEVVDDREESNDETVMLSQSNETPPSYSCYARTSRNRADRLIPGVQLTYAVLSTSPWRGLSALELLIEVNYG